MHGMYTANLPSGRGGFFIAEPSLDPRAASLRVVLDIRRGQQNLAEIKTENSIGRIKTRVLFRPWAYLFKSLHFPLPSPSTLLDS